MDNQSLFNKFPWEDTELGSRHDWPLEMQAVVNTALNSGFPVCTAWGKRDIQIYNDSYNAIYGDKHPRSFGRPVEECWPEIWDFLGPALEQVKAFGQSLWFRDTLLTLAKHDEPEECYFDFSYSPVTDAKGSVIGLISIAVEKTAEVVLKRRLPIAELEPDHPHSATSEGIFEKLRDLLNANEMDAAGAVLYSADPETAGPGREIWSIRTEPQTVAQVRAAAGSTSLCSTSIQILDCGSTSADEPRVCNACLIPILGRNNDPLAALLLIPHPLVPIRRSLSSFAEDLSGRLHKVLHAAEARALELGKVREELAERETFHQFLFSHVRDGLIYASTDGCSQSEEIVLAANPAICAMLGYSEDEIVGMNREALFFPGDEALASAVQTRSRDRSFLGELIFRTKDDRALPVELTSNLAPLRDGRLRSLTIVRDISERVARERDRTEQARLESVAQVTAGVAHDFNNLLTVILGSLEMLEGRLVDTGPERSLASNAMHAAERAAALTGQLLSYSRIQILQAEPIDINDFIEEVAELLRSSLGEISSMRLALSDEPLWSVVDTTQLTSALVNLAVNARDAMPEGGVLTLKTYRHTAGHVTGETDRSALAPGDYACVSVEDTGSGIPPEIRNRIFDPFFTTKKAGNGSGLGLSVVQGFVRQSGGDVQLAPSTGQGTRIDLYFPTAGEAAAGSEPADDPDDLNPAQANGETVLVVEDNELVREQTERMLLHTGFRVIAAENGQDALATLNLERRVDIILTDLIMPGNMSGLQLARMVRENDLNIPVVITTGYDLSLHNDTELAGFQIVRKPYTTAHLARALLRSLRSQE